MPGRIRGKPVPFFLPLAAAAAGIITALHFKFFFFWMTGTVFFFLLTAFLFLSLKIRGCTVCSLVLLFFFFFGYRYGAQRKIENNSLIHLLPVQGSLVGKTGYSVRKICVESAELQSEEIIWQTAGKVIVYYDGPPPPPGSQVKITGDFYTPPSPSNPGQFDYRKYLGFEGVFAAARAENIEVIQEEFPGNVISSIRSYTSGKIKTYFSAPYSTAILSMFMGDPGRMPEDILEDFQRAGITHILAVSGLHVGLVLFIFYYLLSAPGFFRRNALIVSLILMWIFIFVSGVRPSAVRAGTMISFAAVGSLLGGRGNVFNGLAIAALFILSFRPGLLFTAGFQLSFLAVFGIIYLAPVLSAFLGKALGISTAAVVFIVPVLARSFHYIPLAAPLVNLAVIPLASISMATVFLFLFFTVVFPPAAEIYAAAGEVFTGSILKLAEITAASPVAGVFSPAPSWLVLAGLYLGLASTGMMSPRRRKAGLCAAAAILIFAAGRFFYLPSSYIAAIAGADSPSFIVRMGNDDPVLFAGRGRINTDAVINFIRNAGHRRIKHAYIVHPPFDGFEELGKLMHQAGCERIFYPGEVGRPFLWDVFREKVGGEKIDAPSAGEIIQYSGWEFALTEPDKKYIDIRDNYMQGVIRGKKNIFIYAGGAIPDEQFDAVIVMDAYRADWGKLKTCSPFIIYSGKRGPEGAIHIEDKGELFKF